MALCGASLVQIAALDEGRALVVGGGQFGSWSIWMEASKLERVEERGDGAPPAIHPKQDPPRCANVARRLSARTMRIGAPQPRLMARYIRLRRRRNSMGFLSFSPRSDRDKPLPIAEKKEQRAQEMDWENEGGSVKKDERRTVADGSSAKARPV
jgi:hypothetical protein